MTHVTPRTLLENLVTQETTCIADEEPQIVVGEVSVSDRAATAISLPFAHVALEGTGIH